jgi:2-oxoglutarate dehydrogenase E1 component
LGSGVALAFATLIVEGTMLGYTVWLSRGVHSASVILASMTRKLERYCPLDHLVMNQDELFTVLDSFSFLLLFVVYMVSTLLG